MFLTDFLILGDPDKSPVVTVFFSFFLVFFNWKCSTYCFSNCFWYFSVEKHGTPMSFLTDSYFPVYKSNRFHFANVPRGQALKKRRSLQILSESIFFVCQYQSAMLCDVSVAGVMVLFFPNRRRRNVPSNRKSNMWSMFNWKTQGNTNPQDFCQDPLESDNLSKTCVFLSVSFTFHRKVSKTIGKKNTMGSIFNWKTRKNKQKQYPHDSCQDPPDGWKSPVDIVFFEELHLESITIKFSQL